MVASAKQAAHLARINGTKKMGRILSKVELGNFLGCSDATITNYIGAGMPSTQKPYGTKGWQFDSADVVRWLIAQERAARGPQPIEHDDSEDEGKRRIALARAETMELDLARKRGEVVSIQDVSETVEDALGGVRSHLMALPGRIAPRVARLTDQSAIERIIADEVRETLGELSEAYNGNE